MTAYVNGDRAAFDGLFQSLGPRVHGFFVRKFGDPAIADDLLQTTFLKIHRARKDYRVGAPIRPWVFTIAARVGLDEFRRRGRRPEDADEMRLKQASRAASVDRAAKTDAAETSEIAVKVREALMKLPDSQRSVIHLHRFEGMTFKEIGAVLGTTEGAVKLRAFRAYAQLRKQLAPLVDGNAQQAAAKG